MGQELWQDSSLRFDTTLSELDCRPGEFIIDSINAVEDTKGNNGQRGSLTVTNLRFIWVSHRNPTVNLSIGYKAIESLSIKKASSKLRGTTQALCILAQMRSCKYEFMFTSLVMNSPRLFTTAQAVVRAYETSKPYRELKLRGSIMRNGHFVLLPKEKVYSQVDGVLNISTQECRANVGTMIVTNIRFVWYAQAVTNFNVSVPYVQIRRISLCATKLGKALVTEMHYRSQLLLGFQIEPAEKMTTVLNEISSLHKVFASDPYLGVDYSSEEKPPSIEERHNATMKDDITIIEQQEESSTAHLVAGGRGGETRVTFNAKLGLAIEELPPGATLEGLWRVS